MYQKPKGTRDYFNKDAEWLKFIIDSLHSIARFFNFNFIETPIFEHEEVFLRSIGNGSDIVNKEMYSFYDKKERKLALRPEGTAGVIRAIIENKIPYNDYLKLYYFGPMFRYERPQLGRQRQFNQFGVEMIGDSMAQVDAEIILLGSSILNFLKITDVKLFINYLGGLETQTKFKEKIRIFFSKHKENLSEDSKRRLETNVLRILDSKEIADIEISKLAPKISDFYLEEEKRYFNLLLSILKALDIKYEVKETLVRGLDYYSGTIFEFISYSSELGTNNTIIGGGRYDNLIKDFGGKPASGIGFAIGIERLILEAQAKIQYSEIKSKLDVYVANVDEKSSLYATTLTHLLRNAGVSTESNLRANKIAKLFKYIDRHDPKFLIVVGKNEINNDNIIIKNRRTNKETTIKIDEILEFIEENLQGE